MNQLEVVVKDYGLEPTQAEIIKKQFEGYFDLASEWERKAKTELTAKSEDDVVTMRMARDGRLFLRDKRIAVEKTRKELKERSLREGKAIDGVANVLKGLIEPIEEYLKLQEDYAINKVKERKTLLKEERIKLLSPYEINADFYDLENMPEDNFIQLLRSCEISKAEKEAEVKRLEEERIRLEKERLEEERRIREENERLSKERAELEEKLRLEKEKQEAIEKELRKAAEVERAQLEAEIARQKAIQDEMEAQRQAEEKAKQDALKAAEAKLRKDARAPDKAKLKKYAEDLRAVPCLELKTDEAIEIYEDALAKLLGIWNYINIKAEEL